jgi:H+/gluconate symporter-like permease
MIAAACVTCCAPPLIAALGLAAGLVVVVGVFLGIAGVIVGGLLGGAWLMRQHKRRRNGTCAPVAAEPVAVAAPATRERS